MSFAVTDAAFSASKFAAAAAAKSVMTTDPSPETGTVESWAPVAVRVCPALTVTLRPPKLVSVFTVTLSLTS